MQIKEKYDVIVVGAGPAGSSAAEACAKNGLDVLVLNKGQEIGTPKRCGEGLSHSSVQALNLKIPVNCIRQKILGAYVYAPNGKELKIKFKDSKGYIIERKVFDKFLASNAARAGAKIMTKANVYGLIFDGNFVRGVKAKTIDGKISVGSKIVVAADGVESLTLRRAGIKSNKNIQLVDSCFQYEMTNIKLRDPNMIELFLGNKIAPRGYVWVFPKGKDVANVGIGIGPHVCDNGKTAKAYLDKFIENNNDLKKGSILEMNSGCVPVGGLMDNMVSDGILGVGDAVNQVNAIHGGGIAESIFGARIAGNVIKKAFDKNDFSAKFLSAYNREWWKQRGQRLRRIEKLRKAFEHMSDEQMNDLVDVLSGKDLENLVRGNIARFVKILLKYKMKGLARFLRK